MGEQGYNKQSVKYWQDRAGQREAMYQAGSEKAIHELNIAYYQAFNTIDAELRSIAKGLAKAEEGSESAAAYIARKTRLETSKTRIEGIIGALRKKELTVTTERYREAIQDGFYRSLFDMQKGTGLAFSFNLLPQKAIEETLRAGWAGRNYSKSVWRNSKAIGNSLGDIADKMADASAIIIRGGFIGGASVDVMTKRLVEFIQPDLEVARESAWFACERLIRTETNYFANQGELRSYAEAGIEYYEFLATLDNRTSELCQGLDGKMFPVKDANVGENYPPMHPFCRSTTVARFDGEVMEGVERRAKDPVTGEFNTVPADMNYREWKEKYTYNIPIEKGSEKGGTKLLKNQVDSSIINIGGGGMINTGASGAIPRADMKRQNQHAKLFYEEVRMRKGDISAVAKNSGFSIDDVEKIKNHMFFNKYDLGDEQPSCFDPDYDMAVSWQRLTEGKAIQEMDIVLLNHELMEYGLMSEKGLNYHEAHKITEKIYDYAKYVRELNEKEGVL